MEFRTTDLCDYFSERVQVAAPIFKHFGKRTRIAGAIVTVKVPEDNTSVVNLLGQPGNGKIIVVDGDGKQNCALLGDRLAGLAVKNQWTGIIIYGCVRDTAEINELEVGVWALAPHPRKSNKGTEGQINVTLEFAGVRFSPGDYVYADEDGIIVAREQLELPAS